MSIHTLTTNQPAKTLPRLGLSPTPLQDDLTLWTVTKGEFRARFTRDVTEVEKAQRLRYAVFNLELKEGLDSAHALGRDEDEFDHICDHLIVEEMHSGMVVGTYRMQTGTRALCQKGYYCEREFDFGVFESVRFELVELGRACVARHARNLLVLSLLWRGIARYAFAARARYLVGCSSLTSTRPAEGIALHRLFAEQRLLSTDFPTVPLEALDCRRLSGDDRAPVPKTPKLMHAYLQLGARICGPPAFDREFKTIDFLTVLDLHKLPHSPMLKLLGLEDAADLQRVGTSSRHTSSVRL